MKEIAYEIFLDEKDLEKLRIRIHTNKGQVLDVVVQYESLINRKWTPIIRYDCAHGFFHRDELYSKGLKEKQVISITSLKDAVSYAEQDIKDRWEFYKERYLKKLNK
jgi:hypothetical protein